MEAAIAIYSCSLQSVGRSSHQAGTAGAHLSYIGRADAEPVIQAEHMPIEPAKARSWMNREEEADRKNARVLDKIRLALPRELSPSQRAELVQTFAQDLTGGRVPWYAATHQTGEDAHNPHCHLVVRDRDIDTGKRVLKLSDSARDRTAAGLQPKAVEWVRERWEAVCNAALEHAGVDARIDRRSLAAQGIDREPTIHIGPRAQTIETNVHRPTSKIRKDGRGREIDYPMIDAGRTRKERHAEIVDFNLEKAARSPYFETRERAKFERDQRAKDSILERELSTGARRRTLERRRLTAETRAKVADVRSDQKAEQKAVIGKLRETHTPALASLRERHARERDALKAREATLWRRVVMVLDITGRSHKRRDDARKALSVIHTEERRNLFSKYREDRTAQVDAVRTRYEPIVQEIYRDRDQKRAVMRDRHTEADNSADQKRQEREADRDYGRSQLEVAFRVMRGPGASQGQDRAHSPGPQRG